MDLELHGKTALVGGSTAGIGRAVAQLLAAEGAQLTLIARDGDKLRSVLAALPGSGHRFIVADFSQPETVAERVRQHTEAHGGFHILINNTGGPPAGPVHRATLAEFQRAYDMHLKCNHLLMQTCLPFMRAAGYGRIINIISTSVKQPLDNLGVSNTTRGAVANWAKTLANELGPDGITVNNVLPGATATGRLADILERRAEKTGTSVADAEAQMKSGIPARRFAAPEETAAAVAFLASARAGYISGINLPVDGGRTRSL